LVVAWLAGLGAICLGLLTFPALIYTQLQSAQGEIVDYFEALQVGRQRFWKIWGLFIPGLIVAGLGLILFIAPGLFLVQRYLLAPYIIVAENTSIKEALRRSAELSGKYNRELWGIVFIWALIYVVELVIPVVGSVIGWAFGAVYYCAIAICYTRIMDLETKQKSQAYLRKVEKKIEAKKPHTRSKKTS
jgi:hypothetical protein